jgi:hypothetical protein
MQIYFWGRVALSVLAAYAFILWVWTMTRAPATKPEPREPMASFTDDHGLHDSNRDRSSSKYHDWH